MIKEECPQNPHTQGAAVYIFFFSPSLVFAVQDKSGTMYTCKIIV